jgi:hypothetical protein
MQIERIQSRGPEREIPYRNNEGFYELGDPEKGLDLWHRTEHAVRVSTIEAAAELIEKHKHGIRMYAPGKQPSLIRHNRVRIIRP